MSSLLTFVTPVVVFFASLVVVAAFLIGALANPQGLMNQIICAAIDFVASLFPSTPSGSHLVDLINAGITAAGSAVPAIGTGIITQIVQTIASLIAIVLVIKIYKLMPFTFK
jgi:hypothetical protein